MGIGGAASLHTAQVCHVFRADGMVVTSGVNVGDPLGAPDDVCLGDIYEFDEGGPALRLAVLDEATGGNPALTPCTDAVVPSRVAAGSEAGSPGDAVKIEARMVFMAPDASKAEILMIALGDGRSAIQRLFLPLTAFEAGVEYTLIEADPAPPPAPLADVVSVAFLRGSRITLSDGTQRAVEALRPGDLVLTRHNGAQPLRQTIARTVRGQGTFAPVFIPRGVLGNAGNLVVSQHQRLYLYRRAAERIVDRAETLVRARDLVDGTTVTLRRGGFCDYVSLVFDRHEVIYAECIPVESLLVNEASRRQMPSHDRAMLDETLPDLSQEPLHAAEAPASAIASVRPRLLKTPRR
jgi:hypothetical protein